jgi:hypothetical protein
MIRRLFELKFLLCTLTVEMIPELAACFNCESDVLYVSNIDFFQSKHLAPPNSPEKATQFPENMGRQSSINCHTKPAHLSTASAVEYNLGI